MLTLYFMLNYGSAVLSYELFLRNIFLFKNIECLCSSLFASSLLFCGGGGCWI